jgi:hypothetical protein
MWLLIANNKQKYGVLLPNTVNLFLQTCGCNSFVSKSGKRQHMIYLGWNMRLVDRLSQRKTEFSLRPEHVGPVMYKVVMQQALSVFPSHYNFTNAPYSIM